MNSNSNKSNALTLKNFATVIIDFILLFFEIIRIKKKKYCYILVIISLDYIILILRQEINNQT